MQFPTTPTLDRSEPSVLVSMTDDRVVIRPPRRVDIETTHVLVEAAASAITAGAVVMVDVDPDPSADDDLRWFRPRQDHATPEMDTARREAEVLGPGWVRLSTRNAYWTLDLARGRLFRAEKLVDPHFVSEREWTQVRAFWITCTHVTALTTDGTYISTRTSWTRRPTSALPIPA